MLRNSYPIWKTLNEGIPKVCCGQGARPGGLRARML